ncbi:MAG TPA: NTP transferase domain-containing protein [Acidimicrobiales bacterium]|nr:NTP transferase domain-containing protein [Acidimicrobiales bacterium]
MVLAAGAGTRLRPLTELRPKALCPVNNVALLDWALDAVLPHVDAVAVNAHHLSDQVVAHLEGRGVHVSVEAPVALGTAGAIGHLREWIEGRTVLVANADAWPPTDAEQLLDEWDGERIRLSVVGDAEQPDFDGGWRFAGMSLMAAADAALLPSEPAGLYEACWRDALDRGRVELVPRDGFFDCGTPGSYLAANLAANGGRSVIGAGARIDGEVVRSVVWPGGVVEAGERLVDSIRTDTGLTVAAS